MVVRLGNILTNQLQEHQINKNMKAHLIAILIVFGILGVCTFMVMYPKIFVYVLMLIGFSIGYYAVYNLVKARLNER